jgi:diguanylate cyclase (GGDEF)-like protein
MLPTCDDAYEALIQFLYLAPIGLAQIAADGAIDMINPMSAQLLMPLSSDGSLDNLFVVLADLAPDLRRLVDAFEAPSGVVCDAIRFRVDPMPGRRETQQVLSLSLLKMDPNRLMAVLNDVTIEAQREQQGLIRRLQDAARSDSLTQLPNRLAIHEYLQHLLHAGSPGAERNFAVIFLNCDRFKQINDTFGHTSGDVTLRLMADRLRASLRATDALGRDAEPERMAARIGGDEFVVVLDDLARPDDVHVIVRRLIDGLDQPYGVESHQIHCSVSVGIVLGAQAGDDPDQVLQDASIAMSEAKRLGGGAHVVFEPAMRERAERRGKAEAELRHALEHDELFVVYQPVVLLQANGAIDHAAGVEALVRWRHPERGIVPPLEFIGLAEECGLIGDVGAFVLDTACRTFGAWQAALGSRAPRLLAVNLSRAQLADDGFVASVRVALAASGMRGDQLQLEVTESLAAQDETVQARLAELKALGLTLALDDFGTGYSSLASLHQLPVDTVKIDRSFVSQAATSHHHRVLIEATVRVAGSLGMRTVAEGIETPEQAAVVCALGCDKGQGYLFSRPLEDAVLRAWLRSNIAVDTSVQREEEACSPS